MNLLKEIRKKAKTKQSTIILPEANLDKRVFDAGKYVLKHKLAKLIVFGKQEDYSKEFLSSNCKIIDLNSIKLTQYEEFLYKLRKDKGMTLEQAKILVKDPFYLSMVMLKMNEADGVVAGATRSTADTLRPALQIVKTKKNKSIVTGSTIMLKNRCKPLLFGDVSLIQKPEEEQLAEIAISNAEFMDNVLGVQPKVAMLSYSTFGSAKSEEITKVQNACKLANKKSKYIIDGEMQFDSAIDAEVANVKCPNSKVKGDANVFIFPDLNAGNIGYKIAARLGNYIAVGPVMLNFNKPVNDLSRGSSVEEIINTICLTAIME